MHDHSESDLGAVLDSRYVNVTGDTMTGSLLMGDKIIFTQEDGNEAIDSLADGYMDYLATTAHRFNSPIIVPAYERHIQIPAFASGKVADQATGNTVGTAVGLQFSSALDKYAGCQWEIPDDWNGTDAYIEIDWLPDSGNMTGTDTVEWVLEYRSIAEGELINQGTVATVTVTNSDDNAQYKTIHSRFTLDFDGANQPMTKQDHMYFLFHRNTGVTNDFAGTVTATAFEIIYNSTSLPTSN